MSSNVIDGGTFAVPWRSMADALAEDEAEREAERRVRGETAVGVAEDTPCAVCGGSVRAKGAQYDGPWRVHPECTDPTRVLRVLLRDRRVTPDEAEEAWRRVGGVPAYRRSRGALPGAPSGPRRRVEPLRPWAYLGDDDLDKLRAALAQVRKPMKVRRPHRSGSGACAWCGVGTSLTWHRVPGWRWPDGSPAVMCSACVVGWRAAGRPHQMQRDRWPGHALRLLVNASETQVGWSSLGCPVFIESPDADPRGVDVGWSWVRAEAVKEAKVATIGRQPNLALDATEGAVYSAEYQRRRRVIEDERKAQEEAARPVAW